MLTTTLNEALLLPAGAELDRLIAERVMGVSACHPYSTDMATAWSAALGKNLFDGEWALFFTPPECGNQRWVVTERIGGWEFGDSNDAEADTAELAICRAMLRRFWV